MKCEDCKYYHEVAERWGECLHYPCMVEPSDPACKEAERKELQCRDCKYYEDGDCHNNAYTCKVRPEDYCDCGGKYKEEYVQHFDND